MDSDQKKKTLILGAKMGSYLNGVLMMLLRRYSVVDHL